MKERTCIDKLINLKHFKASFKMRL